MRLLILPALLLAACAPTYSDDVYAIERESELRGQPPVVSVYPPPGSDEPAAEGSDVISREELAAAGIPVEPAPSFGGVTYDSGAAFDRGAAEVSLNNPGISDEQDFGAVSSRETIQSDRERLEAQREAYRVIQPEPVPQRPSSSGPNIVAYALNTVNGVGERIYSRSGFNAQNRFNRNCAKYASSDQAQQDFLARGGPERDRLGLDPDGDGFACYWDPTPFRSARGG